MKRGGETEREGDRLQDGELRPSVLLGEGHGSCVLVGIDKLLGQVINSLQNISIHRVLGEKHGYLAR